jgi:hypothetical protein
MRPHRLWIGLLALAACEPGPATPTGEWSVPLKALDGALLSVWGTSSDDVWTVGADIGDGPTVLHYDGAAWTRHTTGADRHAVVGRRPGRQRVDVRRRRPRAPPRHPRRTPSSRTRPRPPSASTASSRSPTPTCGPSAPPTTASAASSTAGTAATGRSPTGLTAELTKDLGFFKIWGPSPDDLWIVGDGGAALHRSGGAWERLDVAGGGTKLFTVHGRDDVVIGVGGAFSGLIVELTPGAITDVTPPISEAEVMQLNGVYVGAKATVAVGAQGSVWQRDDAGKWSQDADAPKTPRDYHSVYVDPDGGLWAVGGALLSDPPTDGVLAHFGPPLASTNIEEQE